MASTTQALIQAKASPSGGSSNPVLTFTANVTAGDLLVAGIVYQSTAGTPTISDTQSNSWAEVGQAASISGGVVVNLVLYWTLATVTGSCTVTGNVSGVVSPSNIWMVIGEFSGANALALISGSYLGFGVNPPYDGSSQSGVIQAVNAPLTTPTGALLIAIASTSAGTATWAVNSSNNWFTIAAQGGGIVLAFALNMYGGAPFCDMTPPKPILDRSGDSSTQWVILTAPFTTTAPSPQLTSIETFDINYRQYPNYPYNPNQPG